MFKKIKLSLLVISILIFNISCSKPTTNSQEPTEVLLTQEVVAEPTVDVDLTKLNKIMMYAKINDMVFNADDYKDNTVKMTGNFDSYYDELSQKNIFTCLVPDPSACCVQGLEFVPKDTSLIYPDHFPEFGSEFTITGTFSIVDAGEYEYITLLDAEILNK